MDQVVSALKLVATSRHDTRRAAACMELAICYACDFVKEYDASENIIDSSSVAQEYILKAAALGDIWARLIAYRVSQAMQMDIPANYPIRLWLFDAASQGSRIALESLEKLNISLHKEALTRYRSTLCGNPTEHFTRLDPILKRDPRATINERGDTFLHWTASTGQVGELESLIATSLAEDVINRQNQQGDTPLLCATRAGHHEILIRLVGQNADASIRNAAGENPLHFLGSLDDDQIPVAAQLLVTAGAAIDAEAKAYTGNTYLQTKPTGKGCPKLRAVMLDQPHVLKALLGLDAYQQSLDHRLRYPTSASTQRIMIAWAIRLRHNRTLEVLQEYFCNSPVYQDIGQIRVWNNGNRHSLLELCILGNVSGNVASGFDVPDKFWRYINHGEEYRICLEHSLTFLADNGVDIFEAPCRRARNGLFFAIIQDNRDAMNFFMSNHSSDLETLFPRSTDRRDIQNQFLRMQKERISKRNKTYNRLRRSSHSSLSFLDSIDQASYASEGPDAYTPDPFSRSRLRRRRRSVRSQRSFPTYSDSSDSAVSESSDEEEELVASDSETLENEERHHTRSSRPDCCRYCGLPDNVSRDGTASLPLDHHRMEGLVDAILLAILCGRRGIFHDLINGPGCITLLRAPPITCWVFTGSDYCKTKEPQKNQHTAYDLRSWFPEHTWRDYFVASSPLTPNHSLEFDGNLCYPLLYMTVVARSTHRDISLA